jgi:ABC-type multidrug transport system fused ATPase/permease subunit
MNPNLIPIKPLDIDKMPKNGSNVFVWILYFIKPYKNVFIPFFFYRIFRFSIFALLPTFIGFFIDAYSTGNINLNPNFYYSLAIVYLGLYVPMLALPGVFKLEGILSENASRSLALLGLKILNKLPISWHMSQSSGRKMDIVNEARRSLFDFMLLFRWQMVPVLGNLIGASIMILVFNGPIYYALLMILFVFVYLSAAWHFGKPLVKSFSIFRETNAKLVARLYEFASSAITVKALSLERFLEREGLRLEEEARDSAVSIYNANFSKWTKVNLITIAFLLFFILRGYFDLLNSHLTPGAFSSILMLFIYVWSGLDGLSVAQDRIYDYLNSIKRFSKLCEEARDNLNDSRIRDFIDTPKAWTELSVKNICFSYPKGGNTLEDISFNIKRNEKVAIVGRSGAGKSTLARLLLGLYDLSAGSIELDNHDIVGFQHSAWLKNISYVPQEIELYDGTIKENILLGDTNFLAEKYAKCIKVSGVEAFLRNLENGDETIIGERGLRLSGGQRQRLGIARALLRDAEIVILDEATSALDGTTEKGIQDILFEELNDITIIIIAHRLSTIKRADRILVLDEGRLVEEGTFADLRDKGGKFTEMWESARI